jgi:hypothetical protein
MPSNSGTSPSPSNLIRSLQLESPDGEVVVLQRSASRRRGNEQMGEEKEGNAGEGTGHQSPNKRARTGSPSDAGMQSFFIPSPVFDLVV